MGNILYGCANFTTEQITIPKGVKIGKFTCISQKDYVCHISEEPDTQCSQSQGDSVCASTCFCMRNTEHSSTCTCMSGAPRPDNHTTSHDGACESVQNQCSQSPCAQICTHTCTDVNHDHTSDVEDTVSHAYKVSHIWILQVPL